MREMAMSAGSRTALPPLMKTLTAMIPTTIGPSNSKPQFLVLGRATRMPPVISITFTKVKKPDGPIDLKNKGTNGLSDGAGAGRKE